MAVVCRQQTSGQNGGVVTFALLKEYGKGHITFDLILNSLWWEFIVDERTHISSCSLTSNCNQQSYLYVGRLCLKV